MEKVKVLFVCMGNICRSPTAEGVFRHLVREQELDGQIYIDSAGTHAYHVGKGPDGRSAAAAAKRGISLAGQTARQVEGRDFERFDYILAMDNDNLYELMQRCPEPYQEKLELFLDYGPNPGSVVPDPYYGGGDGFERVLDLVESGARGLLSHLRTQHLD